MLEKKEKILKKIEDRNKKPLQKFQLTESLLKWLYYKVNLLLGVELSELLRLNLNKLKLKKFKSRLEYNRPLTANFQKLAKRI